MNLRYIPAENKNPLYIAARDSEGAMRATELYVWKGETGPTQVATHYPGLGTRQILGFTNGLAKLAKVIKTEQAAGYAPVYFEAPESAVKQATRARARGEDAPVFRALTFEENQILRQAQGLPALRIAA